MCRQHLLGEHLEMHMFVDALKKRKKIDGFIFNNLFEPKSLYKRHEDLKNEMLKRRYNHKSEIDEKNCGLIFHLTEEQQNKKIDTHLALRTLLNRCPECRKRFKQFG